MKEVEKTTQDKQTDADAHESARTSNEKLVVPSTRNEYNFVARGPITHDADGKRRKTKGEKTFDWLTYGGFGWIANEFVSGEIADQMLEKGGKLNRLYEPTVRKLHETFNVAQKNIKGKSSWITTAATMFVMTLGGHTMVGPIRYLEDRKAKVVRGLDVMIDGSQALDNPETSAKHAAMDKEPQQSWGSLWQGRLVTVISAIAMHFAIGEKDAWSTKLFSKGNPLNNWSSLERINTSVFRKLAVFSENVLKYDVGAGERIAAAKAFETVDDVGNTYKPYEFDVLSSNAVKRGHGYGLQHEGKIASFGKKYGLIFMVSGVLAGLFYVTSKVFASDRDKQNPDAPRPSHHPANPVLPERYNDQLDAAPEAETEKPKNRVENVQPYARLEQQQSEVAHV
ncbi:MAG: hypothetical protein J0M34_01695 [Alphaproteobacteria bacterium]|nr:hypothetical protein [Alphaproteobacteria bacterium]